MKNALVKSLAALTAVFALVATLGFSQIAFAEGDGGGPRPIDGYNNPNNATPPNTGAPILAPAPRNAR